MNLFNILCQESPSFDLKGALLLVFPITNLILLTYGITKLCEYGGKKDDKSKKEFKKGIISSAFFIVMSVILLIILSKSSSILKDPCDNTSPLYSVIKSLINCARVLIPLGFLILSLIKIIESVLKTDKETKRNLRKEAIRYILIAILIFVIITIFEVIMGAVVELPNDSPWKNCWCR